MGARSHFFATMLQGKFQEAETAMQSFLDRHSVGCCAVLYIYTDSADLLSFLSERGMVLVETTCSLNLFRKVGKAVLWSRPTWIFKKFLSLDIGVVPTGLADQESLDKAYEYRATIRHPKKNVF